MGKKYNLKRSVIKRRPKKRGKYKEKPHDPKKPSTAAEKDDKFHGYKELNKVAKGIMEEEVCEKCNEPDDSCECEPNNILNEGFIAPANWGRLMSDNQSTQLLFEQRLQQQREKFNHNAPQAAPDTSTVDDEWERMHSDTAKIEGELSTRLQTIQDRDPSFLKNLTYLVEPILQGRTMIDDEVSEGRRKKTRAETSVSKMKPDAIRTMCQKRFGLMSLEALLNLIDRMNQATSGKLHSQTKGN